jgi:hypothetical protein
MINLAESLPKANVLSLTEHQQVSSVKILPDERGGFVAPELIERKGSQVTAPAVLIVAPAAAGKSTCARATAGVSGALFVDLGSGRRVADGSFLGLLDEALGGLNSFTFLEGVREDKNVIILDSLDETHILSQTLNFIAFIQGLCRFLRTSNGTGNVVMFSRLDTADWIENTFQEEGVPLRILEINFFDESRAFNFLDVKLNEYYDKKKNRQRAHITYRQPYEVVRKLIFQQVAKGLGVQVSSRWQDDDEARRFLGYAPVLEAISTFLAVPNHNNLLQELTADKDVLSVSEWQILRTFAERLLDRERTKWVPEWATEKKVSESILYTIEEQCERLLSFVELKQDRDDLPLLLPSGLRADYSDAARTWIREHPFIDSVSRGYVNSAFRDYLFAWVLSRPDVGEATTQKVMQKLRDPANLPSPALAPFVIGLSTSDHGRAFAARNCDILLSSLYSQEDASRKFEFHITGSSHTGILEIRRPGAVDSLNFGGTVEVPLTTDNQTLRLPSRSHALFVVYDGDIELSTGGQPIQIGPSVSITCESLAVFGPSLLVDPRPNEPVVFDAQLILSDHALEVRSFGRSNFFVRCGSIDGPLAAYRVESDTITDREDLWEAFLALRRILLFFRKTVHTPTKYLATNADTINRYLLLSNPVAKKLMDNLQRDEFIRQDGSVLYLDINALTREGVNHVDVRSFTAPPSVLNFLTRNLGL